MAWRFLNRYFLSVPGYPFSMSVVGNMFSHQQVSHFAANMAVLWIIGTKRMCNLTCSCLTKANSEA